MPEYLLDHSAQTVEFPQETWGQMLAALDGRLARDSRLVTAVRFDGVDQPSFRAAALGATPLAAFRRVEVDTDSFGGILADSFAEARTGIGALMRASRDIAADFRAGHLASGNERLVELVGAVRQLALLTNTAVDATGLDLGAVALGPRTAADRLRDAEAALEGLLDAQEHRDWIGVAACLDDALAPALDAWSLVFTAIERAAA